MAHDNTDLTRRGLLVASATGLVGALTVCSAGAALIQAPPQTPAPAQKPQRPPPLPPDQVKAFVIAAHVDFDKVKSMLADEPRLLNSTIDWTHGDFEAAIGGAGHMGRRDIAEFLIENGARMDIFVAAMLGHLDVVKSTLTAHPKLIDSKGPHGIPLLYHARAGGDNSKDVLAYLQSLSPAPEGTKG